MTKKKSVLLECKRITEMVIEIQECFPVSLQGAVGLMLDARDRMLFPRTGKPPAHPPLAWYEVTYNYHSKLRDGASVIGDTRKLPRIEYSVERGFEKVTQE